MNNKPSLSLTFTTDKSPKTVGETTITLSELEGWDELTQPQQNYLYEFAQSPLTPKTTTAKLGLPVKTVEGWFNSTPFGDIANLISDIFTESYKELDAVDAITNSKIRNRVIQSLERGGKYSQEPKEENHNHLHITMADFLKLQEGKG